VGPRWRPGGAWVEAWWGLGGGRVGPGWRPGGAGMEAGWGQERQAMQRLSTVINILTRQQSTPLMPYINVHTSLPSTILRHSESSKIS